MLGVILCGGESSRMGQDKGLIATQATTWAEAAVEKMSTLGIPVVLSVNSRQKNSYQAIFSDKLLIPDNPELPLKGPLTGILSAHLQYPADDLFVLACDLPYMEPALLNDLYVTQNGRSQVYLYSNDDQPEPLCGIYTANGLCSLLRLLQSGQLAKHSMKYALEQLLVDLHPIPENKKHAFTNVNTPDIRPEGHAG